MSTRARIAGALVPAAVMFTLLAGCGPATPGPMVSATTAPAAAPAAPPTAPQTATDAVLPWPPGSAAALQSAVDGGAQPWLLDPTEVATSYAAARGWTAATVRGADATAETTTVTVISSAGTHMLTLAQPGRRGIGGIWRVTADSSR